VPRTIAETIINLRTERGLTKAQLARAINTSKTSITLWENGQRIPNREFCNRLCELFSVDYAYLTGKSEIKNASADSESVINIPIYKYSEDLTTFQNEVGQLVMPDFALRKNRSFFALIIEDDSMQNYGLRKEDIAIFEKAIDHRASDKEMICAMYDKKIYIRTAHLDNSLVMHLVPGNPRYEEIQCKCYPTVLGVLAAVFSNHQL
jgi:transcriptional regulator with XRE-family HTH domain